MTTSPAHPRMEGVSRNLGSSPGALPPPATRVARTGWRDPRLWIGVVLLCASVLGGARLLASADATEPVWAVRADAGAGATLGADDVEIRRVRFADDADLALYFDATQPLPEGLVLGRSVGAGELLPRGALRPADEVALRQVPLEVAPHQVPPSVQTGSVIDVYLDDRAVRVGAGRRGATGEGRALTDVTVVAAPTVEETFAVSGMRQIVVAVPADDVEEFQALLASMEDPVLSLTAS